MAQFFRHLKNLDGFSVVSVQIDGDEDQGCTLVSFVPVRSVAAPILGRLVECHLPRAPSLESRHEVGLQLGFWVLPGSGF